ncbi:C-type lectin domain family 4 member C-like [Macrobrachium rosenbergii]|uniref:C-type lectin domain family 4 member C-like n=1 Tax=Macrobrachium rosenbergii TaxID=79674 RepID=UPI0034D3A423
MMKKHWGICSRPMALACLLLLAGTRCCYSQRMNDVQSELLVNSINHLSEAIREISAELKPLKEISAKLEPLKVFLPCKSGWFKLKSTCYFISEELATWDQSLQNCTDMGADFVKVSLHEQFLFLQELAKGHDVWIGLRDYEGKNAYKWAKDSTVHVRTALWWEEREPNSSEERCAHFKRDTNKWNDMMCHQTYRYFCEKPLGTA